MVSGIRVDRGRETPEWVLSQKGTPPDQAFRRKTAFLSSHGGLSPVFSRNRDRPMLLTRRTPDICKSLHAQEFRYYPKLMLIVPAQEPQQFRSRYRANLTPQERIEAMDAAAEKNRHLPILPPEAFDRESLYAEEGEIP